MSGDMSLPLAQLLTTAIALAYGLVFLGLWLSLRRQTVLAFAGVWMAQGALAVATATLAPLANRSGVVRVLLPTLVLLTTLLFVDLALVTAARSRARRRFWQWALPLLALGAAALALLNDPNRLPGIVRLFRMLTSATLAAALVLVWRAPPSAGKRSTFVAVALVFARFAGGLVLTLAVPDAFTVSSQPVAFTVYQLLVTLLAGFFTTVAIFAVERESTLRERVVLERAVASAQRMESLGRMAGSVAHDFNNVLGALLASSELAMAPEATAADRAIAAQETEEAVLRGKELTGRLVAFSKPTAKQDVLFDPTERVRELLPMLKRLAGADVAVTLNASLAQPMAPIAIRADPAQFDQVMLNLTANARDAMPDGGRLTVGTLVVDGRDARVQAAELPDGTYLALRVADTGTGIPVSAQDRIFEPFFTTKAEGQGTGLGLATAFAFVQSCGGTIAVESVPGAGATFFIHLPLARPHAPRRPSNPGH